MYRFILFSYTSLRLLTTGTLAATVSVEVRRAENMLLNRMPQRNVVMKRT